MCICFELPKPTATDKALEAAKMAIEEQLDALEAVESGLERAKMAIEEQLYALEAVESGLERALAAIQEACPHTEAWAACDATGEAGICPICGVDVFPPPAAADKGNPT